MKYAYVTSNVLLSYIPFIYTFYKILKLVNSNAMNDLW